jgi:hypothetical protein
MEIKLDVTLDTTTTPPYLDVDEQDKSNHIPRNPVRQTIKWKLTSNASGGTFNSMDDPNNPGFQWASSGPGGTIFTTATVSPDGKEITITDLNDGNGSVGQWVYQLSAMINGSLRQSNKTSPAAVVTNPMIKNN